MGASPSCPRKLIESGLDGADPQRVSLLREGEEPAPGLIRGGAKCPMRGSHGPCPTYRPSFASRAAFSFAKSSPA